MANKHFTVGQAVRIAIYGSFEHLQGYIEGTVLAIGVTDTGWSTRPHPAAIVAWQESKFGPARVDACPLFRLETK